MPTIDLSPLEWQVAEGSTTGHVIDTATPGGRRTGPKALCGRRPQRHWGWWWALPVTDPDVLFALPRMGCSACPDCKQVLRVLEMEDG